MFFKMTVLKRLMKKAYKGPGLTVGRNRIGEDMSGIYLSGGYWIIWHRDDEKHKMPKELKAAIIELCGELPLLGEQFKVNEGGSQYEIEIPEVYNIPKIFGTCRNWYEVTKLMCKQSDVTIRFLQNESKNVEAINEVFIDLINTNAVEPERGECMPYGPVAKEEKPRALYWGNNVCYLMVCPRYPLDFEEEMWTYLEGVNIVRN